MKVLIIKTGFSETLDPEENGRRVSLGDVVRTTVILNEYRNDHVTWVTAPEAIPLLEGNPDLARLFPWDIATCYQLGEEIFDTVICLEKVPGIAAWAGRLNAWRRFGFRYDGHLMAVDGYAESQEAMAYIAEKQCYGMSNGRPWQAALYKMIGATWNGQEYVLGKTREEVTGRIGFNWRTGEKWRHKAWPTSNWHELWRLSSPRFEVSDQEGEKDLRQYMQWVASCQCLVTNDSLGMHLALGYGRRVVAIFQETNPDEVCTYGRGEKLIRPTPQQVYEAICKTLCA